MGADDRPMWIPTEDQIVVAILEHGQPMSCNQVYKQTRVLRRGHHLHWEGLKKRLERMALDGKLTKIKQKQKFYRFDVRRDN